MQWIFLPHPTLRQVSKLLLRALSLAERQGQHLFESQSKRLIFHLFGATRTYELYQLFNSTGKFALTSNELQILQSQNISAVEINGKTGAENITLVENKNDYRMCPHTAIGYSALQNRPGKKILGKV